MATQSASKRKNAGTQEHAKPPSGAADDKHLQKLQTLHREFEARQTAEPSDDPILALIDMHRSQELACGASHLSDDESDALSDIAGATWWKLLDTGPSTVTGAATYANYVAETEQRGRCPTNRIRGDDSTHTDVCMVALHRVAASLSVRALIPEKPISADPVFAAIDLCKTAMADNDRLAKLEIGGGTPEAEASQQRLLQAGDRWMAAFSMLVATPPKSPQGLEALCSFILHFTEEWGGDDGEVVLYENWKSLVKSLRLFVLDSAKMHVAG